MDGSIVNLKDAFIEKKQPDVRSEDGNRKVELPPNPFIIK